MKSPNNHRKHKLLAVVFYNKENVFSLKLVRSFCTSDGVCKEFIHDVRLLCRRPALLCPISRNDVAFSDGVTKFSLSRPDILMGKRRSCA